MRSLPFSILIAGILSVLMLYFTGLIPAFGEWYSYDQTLRLQTEAFLRGELALQPVPYGHREDWVWGNGIQQIWGLGVPIIKLPFEIIANLFGFFGFPDRLIFLTFYLLVTAIFWKSLNCPINPPLSDKEQLTRRLQNISILFFVMLNSAFITMMRARFQPYEEVIAYGYLWALMLFALMYRFINNCRSYPYLSICLLAGFSPNIRPTIGAYGAVTFLIVFYLAVTRKVRFRWLGIPVFLFGNIFLLITNYLRFGYFLEFGHRLLLTGPLTNYLLKFDNPFRSLPFRSAAMELISALFFIDISKGGIFWQASASRMREFNFEPYSFFILTLLLSALGIVGSSLLWRRCRDFSSNRGWRKIINAGAIWSLISFVMLFYFYSSTPALASRYLVDFGPAIVVGVVILYFYLMDILRERLLGNLSLPINITLCAVIIGWVLVSVSQAKIAPFYRHLSKVELTNVTTYEIARKKLETSRRTTGPPLPVAYRCNDRETMYGILFNNNGWKTTTDCGVFWVTSHFLDNPTCLALHVEPSETIDKRLGDDYSDREIQVKIGLMPLDRISEMQVGRGKVITYCGKEREESHKPSYGNQLKLVSIAWIDFRKHPTLFQEKYFKLRLPLPPIKLLSLEKVR